MSAYKMKRKKENQISTPSSFRINEEEKQSEIVPITHTVYYEKNGDSLSPLSSTRTIAPNDGYDSDSDLFTLIEEIQNEFEIVKLDFDKITRTQVEGDDESECSSKDFKGIRTTNSTITTATATTTSSTITSIKRSPSYEQIFENFFSSFEECFDNSNDEEEMENQEIRTFFRNNSPRSIFFDMELLTNTNDKSNDHTLSKTCSNQQCDLGSRDMPKANLLLGPEHEGYFKEGTKLYKCNQSTKYPYGASSRRIHDNLGGNSIIQHSHEKNISCVHPFSTQDTLHRCESSRYLKQDSTLLSVDSSHLQMDFHKNINKQTQQYNQHTLHLQLRAHKLKKKIRKKGMKKIMGKKKPSTYFEIYRGSRQQSSTTQIYSGW